MSKKRSETSRGEEPPERDDLRLINGIGSVVERRLNGIGIYTYAQLAALSPADIAAAVGSTGVLTSERIIKEDWIGQARKRATGSLQMSLRLNSSLRPLRALKLSLQLLLSLNLLPQQLR
jgi:predicted flap endonuclease-1-like 5' DNA nuclease